MGGGSGGVVVEKKGEKGKKEIIIMETSKMISTWLPTKECQTFKSV